MNPAAASSSLQAGPDWWRLVGALVVVLALLLLGLRLLQRWLGARAGSGPAGLLAVHRLGPSRSVDMVRWRDQVYVVYRGEGAALLLEREPFDPDRHGPAAAPGRFPLPWHRPERDRSTG